ncbi:TRAP transporter small permease [Granulosicoccus antarcticus]|uniref:TRAP transporter small permease protein n=1 Tax=Granulosicoccus antarcticus IMCC3135 TaxID=1192854 RepID=A0A2Z2P0L4_9GAMM|nr:TRAP transporter small permease [Granulosicoccus antarcticus]ASJ73757.1 hypothetical protein IMCC3135_18390 [Granulosicoccus antarcticus IMCC3135]
MLFRVLGGILFSIGGASLLALMSTSVSDAIMRATANPFIGAKELSEAFLVCCVAISLPVSVYRGKAIAIDGFVAFFPDVAKRLITAAGNLSGALVCALLSYELIRAGADAHDFAEKSTLLGIPYQLYYQILSFGFGLTTLAFLFHIKLGFKSNEPARS